MKYADARPLIRDGDLIAVRSRHGGMPAAVRLVTRSPYTHTAVAVWVGERLLVAETRGVNACLAPLSQHAGNDFDVFPCPVERRTAVAALWGLLGDEIRYDYGDLLRIAAHELLGVPLPEREDGKLICSALSASIYLLAHWEAALPSIPTPRDVVRAVGRPALAEVRHA